MVRRIARTVVVEVVYEPLDHRPPAPTIEEMVARLFGDMVGHHSVRVEVGPPSAIEVVELNRPRLISTLAWVAGEHAKEELGLPSEWDQDWWFQRKVGEDEEVPGDVSGWCGTAACFAGKVAIDEGGIPEVAEYEGAVSDYVIMPDGSREAARSVAMRVLGLTPYQADVLFAGSNTYEDIKHVVAQLLDGVENPTSRLYPVDLD